MEEKRPNELTDQALDGAAGGIIYQGEPGCFSKTTRCERCGDEFSYLVMWQPGWNCYEVVPPRYCPKCRQR